MTDAFKCASAGQDDATALAHKWSFQFSTYKCINASILGQFPGGAQCLKKSSARSHAPNFDLNLMSKTSSIWNTRPFFFNVPKPGASNKNAAKLRDSRREMKKEREIRSRQIYLESQVHLIGCAKMHSVVFRSYYETTAELSYDYSASDLDDASIVNNDVFLFSDYISSMR